MTVRHRLDQKHAGAISESLRCELPLHRDVPPVEGPRDGHRRIALEHVALETGVVTVPERIQRRERKYLRWNWRKQDADRLNTFDMGDWGGYQCSYSDLWKRNYRF